MSEAVEDYITRMQEETLRKQQEVINKLDDCLKIIEEINEQLRRLDG